MNVIPLHSVFHHFYLEVDLSAKLSWSYHRLQWRRTGPLLPLDATFNPAQWVLKASPTVTLVHPCLEHARNVRPPLWLNTATGSVEPLDLFCLLNNLSRHSLEPRRKIVNSKIAVDIPDYIARTTCIVRSYHGTCFAKIGSNNNTYKYNIIARTVMKWNSLLSSLFYQPSACGVFQICCNWPTDLLIDFITVLLWTF